jgi:catechol 2,3-dioxygenase-like lactoylglutathione lyase family enzyme
MSNGAGSVLKLHHTGYTVSNLERSLGFYRDLLGCEVVATQEKQGGYLAEIVGYPDAHVRMAHLRAPESNHMIELFEYIAPKTARPQDVSPLEPRDVGTSHISFVVEDLAAVYERLRGAGVAFFSPPVDIDTGLNAGGKALYLRDPDGIPMELFQPPRRNHL